MLPTADAEVLFDGSRTKQTGTEREFQTPPLPAGRDCHYTVTASWVQDGKEVRRERRIAVSQGAQVVVDFVEMSR